MCCCVLLCVVVCCGVLLCVSEENRRKNEGERAGEKNIKWSLVKATRPLSV